MNYPTQETDRNLRASLALLHMTLIDNGSQAELRGSAIQAIGKMIELRGFADPLPEYANHQNHWFNYGDWPSEL